MISAQLKIYFNTRLFWVLNALSLGMLLLYSLLMVGMDRVGLMPMTAFDYLINANNTYVTTLFPLLVVLFSAYTFSAEYRYRTLMIPLFEGVPRKSIVLGKVVLCAISTLTFVLVYFVGSVGLGFGLFSSQDMFLENRVLSALEVICRMGGAMLWTALLVFLFGLLALFLVVQFRNVLIATIGAFLAFLGLLFTTNTRHNPFAPMLQVATLLIQSADLTAVIHGPLVPGFSIWLATVVIVIGGLWVSFHRRDIVFD